MRCAVLGCKSDDRIREKESGLIFFSFPNDANIQQAWKNACGCKDKFDIKNARVCSKHFKDSDYSKLKQLLMGNCPKYYRTLNPNAIPSEHLPEKQCSVSSANNCEKKQNVTEKQTVKLAKPTVTTLLICQKINNSEGNKGSSVQGSVVKGNIVNSSVSYQPQATAPATQPLLLLMVKPDQKTGNGDKLQTCSNVLSTTRQIMPLTDLSSVNTENNICFNDFSNQLSSSAYTKAASEEIVNVSNVEVMDPLSSTIKIEEEDVEFVETFQCRTCLKTAEATVCVPINQDFVTDKTIKDVIVLLVPEMDSKLSDDEVVCDECVNVLKSTMEFVARCREVEAILARNERNEKEAEKLKTYKLETEVPELVVEHDYCVIEEAEGSENEATDEIGRDNFWTDFNDVSVDSDFSTDEKSGTNESPSNVKEGTKRYNKKKKDRLTCSTCFERFPTKEEYDEHLEFHPPYSCEICGKTFQKKDSERAHRNTHNDPNSFLCEVCGKGFKDWNILRNHLNIHVTVRSYMCDKCPKVFKTKPKLHRHFKTVHDRKFRTQCTVCGLVTTSKSSMQSHIRLVHRKEKPYECNICYRRFGRSDYLKNHKLNHTGENRPTDKCQANGKRRTHRSWKRYKTENPGRLLPCKFCEQKCKDVKVLRQHLMLHLKRFPCRFCPLTFTCNARVKAHEETHQGGAVSFMRCNVCWKKFKTKEILDQHVALHDKPRHACDVCGETFNRKFLVIQHKLKEHNDNPGKDQIDTIIDETLMEVGILPT